MSSGRAAANTKPTANSRGLSKYDKMTSEASWDPNSRGVSDAWKSNGGIVAKSDGGVGKGLGELSLDEQWTNNGPRPNAKPTSAKGSKANDWGLGKGGDTHGW
jgi:hypothetical protein